MSAAQEILMLRHGMTPGNELRQYIGRTDEPLSQKGRDALAELEEGGGGGEGVTR